MKWKSGKYKALILSVVMSATPVLIVSAEGELGEGSGTGTGMMEGNVKTEIYQVAMPTNADGIFDFILDPQRLINKTKAAAYNGLTFEENSTVFFRRSDEGAEEDYSSTSDAVTIVNKSSIAVDVSFQVEVVESSAKGITITDDEEFTDDTSASLYLAVTDGENVIPIGESGAIIQTTIPAAPEEAYEYIYDSDSGEYTYGLKEDLYDIEFADYSFQLIGAANGAADWSGLTEESPKIVVTWNVSPSE